MIGIRLADDSVEVAALAAYIIAKRPVLTASGRKQVAGGLGLAAILVVLPRRVVALGDWATSLSPLGLGRCLVLNADSTVLPANVCVGEWCQRGCR